MAIRIVKKSAAARTSKAAEVTVKAASKPANKGLFVSTYTWEDKKGVAHEMVSIATAEELLQGPRAFNLSINNLRRVVSAAKALGLA